MKVIEISHLKKSYQMGEVVVEALNDVSFSVEKGEFVAIMGPSGSGKSTLLQILGLLDVPSSGSFKLLGQEVSGLDEEALASLRSKTIGFVFQQFNLLRRASAIENVSLPLLYSTHRADLKKAEGLLKMVGLGDRCDHKPNELSGGQQQRVAIARSLINDPTIILADEPTGNLDSVSEAEILKILIELNQRGMTVIIVTHEKEIAAQTQRVIRMRDGMIQSDEKNALHLQSQKSPPATEPAPLHRPWFSSFNYLEMAQHFRQAWRALMSNKVRSMLSLLGILIGVASLIAMLALGSGAKQSIESRLASLGTNLLSARPGSIRTGGVALEAGAVTRMTLDDAKDIQESIPGVKQVAGSVSGRGQVVFGGKNWNTLVQGTTVDYAQMHASEPVVGRFFTAEEDQQRMRLALLGLTVVRELFGDANPIGENIKINKVNFQVIGVLPEKGATGFRDQDDVIIVPLNTAMRRLLGKDYIDSLDIEMENPEQMEPAQDSIKNLLMRRHQLPPIQNDAFQIRNMADIASALSETSKTMSWLLASIATISLLVGGIGIMNIMLVSVTERTREIGLRKAVGAEPNDILSQFLIESALVSLLGGVLGIGLGWGISIAMAHFAGWSVEVTSQSILLAVVFSLTVGIIFGLWPARKASLLNPIDALRYE
jgi:macrolide transport system ATP-binding/permease protein